MEGSNAHLLFSRTENNQMVQKNFLEDCRHGCGEFLYFVQFMPSRHATHTETISTALSDSDFVNEKANPNVDVVTPGRTPVSPEERLRGKHFAISTNIRCRCAVCGIKKIKWKEKRYNYCL